MGISSLAIVLLMTGGGVVAAQKEEQPEYEEIEPEQFRKLTVSEIRRVAREKDLSRIAELRSLRAWCKRKQDVRNEVAQIALAKMGQSAELKEILRESRSKMNHIRSSAIKKLGEVGGELAVARLVELLDSWENGIDSRRKEDKHDVLYEAPAIEAMQTLAKMFPDGPALSSSKRDAEEWKRWLKRSEH